MTMQAHILRAAGAVANAKKGPRTYSEFLDLITDYSVRTLTGNVDIGAFFGLSRVDSIVAVGSVYGSSWGTHFSSDSSVSRLVQHGLPSQSVFNQIRDQGQSLLIDVENIGNQASFTSVDRNGYISLGIAAAAPARSMPRLWFWDDSQGASFEMRPYQQTGPFPWDGTI